MKRFPERRRRRSRSTSIARPTLPPGVRVGGRRASPRQRAADHRRRSSRRCCYTTQLAAISQDPWFSRVQHPPSSPTTSRSISIRPTACRSRACSTSRAGFATSSTRSEALGVAEDVGRRRPARLHPAAARTRRTTPGCCSARSSRPWSRRSIRRWRPSSAASRARGARVYVDYLQNILGKTLATAYSARASDYAGVSTPLTWQEVDEGVDRTDFTIQNVPARLEKTGDLWAALRKSKGVDLARVARYAERAGKGRLKGDRS